MGARTGARHAALQMLFAADLTGTTAADNLLRDYWREFPGDPEDRPYADAAVRGVLSSRPRLDALIEQASTNWRIERMSPVTRNILRLGTWELTDRREIPTPVVLDEAIEMSKQFGTKDTSAFVNGVLNRVAELERKDKA